MLKAKQKIKIDIVVFSLFLVLIIFLAIVPLSSQLKKDSKNLATKKSALIFLENQIKALNDFQNSSSKYQEKISKLNSSFVSKEAPIEFIEFLEKEAKKQGLKISLSSNMTPVEQKENSLTVGFGATLTGDFPDVLVFLQKMEKSPWLIKVEQVNINRIESQSNFYQLEDAKVGQVTLSLNFKTFSSYISQKEN